MLLILEINMLKNKLFIKFTIFLLCLSSGCAKPPATKTDNSALEEEKRKKKDAEDKLQTAQNDLAKAQADKLKAEGDLTAIKASNPTTQKLLEAEKQAAVEAQKTAEQEKKAAVEAQKTAEQEKKAAVDAQKTAENNLEQAKEAEKQANLKLAQAEKDKQEAVDAKTEAETKLAQAEKDKEEAKNNLAQAEKDKQEAVDAKNLAEAEKQAAVTAKNKAELSQTEAQTKLAQAEKDKQEAVDAKTEAENKLKIAESNTTKAKGELENAKKLLGKSTNQAELLAAQTAKAEAETKLELAERAEKAALKDKTEAENKLVQADAAKTKAEQEKQVAEQAKADAENKLVQAEAAKTKAEQEKQAAVAAQNKAELAQTEAETKLAQAEAAQKAAVDAKNLAEAEKQTAVEAEKLAKLNLVQAEKDKQDVLDAKNLADQNRLKEKELFENQLKEANKQIQEFNKQVESQKISIDKSKNELTTMLEEKQKILEELEKLKKEDSKKEVENLKNELETFKAEAKKDDAEKVDTAIRVVLRNLDANSHDDLKLFLRKEDKNISFKNMLTYLTTLSNKNKKNIAEPMIKTLASTLENKKNLDIGDDVWDSLVKLSKEDSNEDINNLIDKLLAKKDIKEKIKTKIKNMENEDIETFLTNLFQNPNKNSEKLLDMLLKEDITNTMRSNIIKDITNENYAKRKDIYDGLINKIINKNEKKGLFNMLSIDYINEASKTALIKMLEDNNFVGKMDFFQAIKNFNKSNNQAIIDNIIDKIKNIDNKEEEFEHLFNAFSSEQKDKVLEYIVNDNNFDLKEFSLSNIDKHHTELSKKFLEKFLKSEVFKKNQDNHDLKMAISLFNTLGGQDTEKSKELMSIILNNINNATVIDLNNIDLSLFFKSTKYNNDLKIELIRKVTQRDEVKTILQSFKLKDILKNTDNLDIIYDSVLKDKITEKKDSDKILNYVATYPTQASKNILDKIFSDKKFSFGPQAIKKALKTLQNKNGTQDIIVKLIDKIEKITIFNSILKDDEIDEDIKDTIFTKLLSNINNLPIEEIEPQNITSEPSEASKKFLDKYLSLFVNKSETSINSNDLAESISKLVNKDMLNSIIKNLSGLNLYITSISGFIKAVINSKHENSVKEEIINAFLSNNKVTSTINSPGWINSRDAGDINYLLKDNQTLDEVFKAKLRKNLKLE
jgi:hypothetical protein